MEEQKDTIQVKDGIKRDSKGRIVKGSKPLNPIGRLEGSTSNAYKIKQAFYDAFELLGGLQEMVKWIKSSPHNKKEFYKMLLQVLPKEIKGEFTGGNRILIIDKIIQEVREEQKIPTRETTVIDG